MSTSDMVLLISLKNEEEKLNSKKSKLFFDKLEKFNDNTFTLYCERW